MNYHPTGAILDVCLRKVSSNARSNQLVTLARFLQEETLRKIKAGERTEPFDFVRMIVEPAANLRKWR
jgi:hypothetical protein